MEEKQLITEVKGVNEPQKPVEDLEQGIFVGGSYMPWKEYRDEAYSANFQEWYERNPLRAEDYLAAGGPSSGAECEAREQDVNNDTRALAREFEAAACKARIEQLEAEREKKITMNKFYDL